MKSRIRSLCNLVGCKVSAAVYIVSSLYWDVTQCWLVIISRRFGTTCRPHLQGPSLLLLSDTPSACKYSIGLRILIQRRFIVIYASGISDMLLISGTHDVRENGCHRPQMEREEAELAVVDQFSVLTILRTLLGAWDEERCPKNKKKGLLAYIRFVWSINQRVSVFVGLIVCASCYHS
jgi:hypothetical protein